MNVEDVSRFTAQITGLASSVLTLALGVIHVSKERPSLSWPKDNFFDDVQAGTWRAQTFTLKPDMFLDLWTPIIFGLSGILAHSSRFELYRRITGTYGTYFVWLVMQALFANLGYRGGMGILVGAISGLAALLSLVAYLLGKDSDGGVALKNGLGVTI